MGVCLVVVRVCLCVCRHGDVVIRACFIPGVLWLTFVVCLLQDALAQANAVAGQILGLIRVIRSHGSEEKELGRYIHTQRGSCIFILMD